MASHVLVCEAAFEHECLGEEAATSHKLHRKNKSSNPNLRKPPPCSSLAKFVEIMPRILPPSQLYNGIAAALLEAARFEFEASWQVPTQAACWQWLA